MRISDWSSDVCSSDLNGVSRDPAVVAAYRADPLVYGGKIGARLGKEFMDAMAVARADAPKICLPILIQHGEADRLTAPARSEEHTSELQSLMRISYAVFCLKKKNTTRNHSNNRISNN